MWAGRIVVLPPHLNHDLRFGHIPKPLQRQTFVPQPPVEAFPIRILPGTPRLNLRGLHLLRFQPPLHGLRNEFRSVVTAQVGRHAVLLEDLL